MLLITQKEILEEIMSAEQYQRNINSLDKDIASLEKKKAEADKKCAELQKKINSTQKSISSRTSASMTASKIPKRAKRKHHNLLHFRC